MIENKSVRIDNALLAVRYGVKPGSVVQVECKNDVPTNREWRNRFKDSKIDGCITVIQNDVKTTKPPKESS